MEPVSCQPSLRNRRVGSFFRIKHHHALRLLLIAVTVIIFSPTVTMAQVVGSGPGVPQEPSVEQSLESRLDNLRSTVRAAQRDYVDALRGAGTEVATDYLDRLRAELRSTIQQMLQQAGGDEVTLTVKRAAVSYRLDQINSFERMFGLPPGEFSTRWNLFTSAELDQLASSLRTRLAELAVEAARYPATERPLPLSARLLGVGTELDAIAAEKAMRGSRENTVLRTIPRDLNWTEAERRLTLRTPVADVVRAERALLVEIEKGIQWNARSVELRTLELDIRRGPHRGAIIALIAGGPHSPQPWPPHRPGPSGASPSPTRPDPGPLGPPSGGSVSELSASARLELEARRRGDALRRAESRASRDLHADYVRLATGTVQDGRQLALSAMSDLELRSLLDGYKDWQSGLLRAEQAAGPAHWHGAAELEETRGWISAAEAEIRNRGPPRASSALAFHGPEELRRALGGPPQPDGPELAAFRDTAEVRLSRTRLVALQATLAEPASVTDPTPGAVADPRLSEALQLQRAGVLEAEVQAVNRFHSSNEGALREALVSGRGDAGRQAGSLAVEAQSELRAYGQALQREIERFRSQATHPDAILRLSSSVHPLLLAPPPIAREYAPDRLGRIAVAVRGAQSVSAMPRAPPLTVGMPPGSRQAPLRLQPEQSVDISVAASRLPASSAYGDLFDNATARSYRDLVSDIRRAPGGVILDLRLELSLADTLRGVSYDVPSRTLWLETEAGRLRVEPTPGPATARAALGFVLDGRVAAADIRPASTLVAFNFLQSLPRGRLSGAMLAGQEARLLAELLRLQEVNLHPALADTEIGSALVAADQIIFDALGDTPISAARFSHYRGLPFEEARRRRTEDLVALGLGGSAASLKSILSATQVIAETQNDTLRLSFPLRYEIYYLPASGEPRLLARTSEWLERHDAALQSASTELQHVAEFATAVTVLRTALELGLPLDISALVPIAEDSATPRFFCRAPREVGDDYCALSTLRRLID
jgi:hypothetical protein